MMKRFVIPALMTSSLALAPGALPTGTASAQDSRYQTWGQETPAGGGDQLQQFIDKLNQLVDDAERARAADPRFLRDLRDLAQGFDRPWKKQVFTDDFQDGDFSSNPAWTVTKGQYFVERGFGLRNRIEQAVATQNQQQPADQGQQALQLFGAILGTATGQPGFGAPSGTAAQSGIAPTRISTNAPVSNAFALSLRMSSWQAQGRFQASLYQGSGQVGYRLAYEPADRTIKLERFSSRGVSVLDSRQLPAALEDRQAHGLEWTRGQDGTMVVSVDGAEIVRTVDRGLNDGFQGVELGADGGGDFIVSNVTLNGLP